MDTTPSNTNRHYDSVSDDLPPQTRTEHTSPPGTGVAYLGLQLDFRVLVQQQVSGAGRISQLTAGDQLTADQLRTLPYTT